MAHAYKDPTLLCIVKATQHNAALEFSLAAILATPSLLGRKVLFHKVSRWDKDQVWMMVVEDKGTPRVMVGASATYRISYENLSRSELRDIKTMQKRSYF